MKRKRKYVLILLVASLLVSLSGGAYATVIMIQVDSPATGATWNQGNNYQIHWLTTNSSGGGQFPPVGVKLLLFPPGQPGKALTIAEFSITDSSTGVGWTVPSNVSAGSYVIRVQTNEMTTHTDPSGSITYGNKYGESGVFTIAHPPQVAVLPGQPGWVPPGTDIFGGPITSAGTAAGGPVAEKKSSAAAKKFANLSAVDVSGQWKSSIGLVYDIKQTKSQFEWIVSTVGEKGEGVLKGNDVSASWKGNAGAGSATGKITAVDSSGKATQIEWNNGVRFYR
jgi:hypothetical protein